MQSVHVKLYCSDKLWGNLEPIVHFTLESFSPVAADEVTEMVDSAGDLEEDESISVRSLTSEGDEPDLRVPEEVSSRTDYISNSM